MVELDKLLYEEEKWKKIATALEEVNEAHKYDDKYEKADQLFEDSKSEIVSKDVDGAISFKTKTYQPEAKPIREDYSKLYDYAKNIGKIIDEKVDTPFYKSIDGYIQKMADLTISSYSTANTIDVKEGFLFKHEKDSITIDDLYNTDTTYSQNLKTEFENWKLQNKDQDVSEEDYRTAALHTGAFEYEGIRAGQEKKEFWFNLVSAGLIIGLTIVCPPAGLVAGGIYTAIDVAGAVKGEDLISGRKLSDDERIMRGVFSVVPAAGGLAAKTILRNVPALANVLKTASKTVDDAIKPIKNTVSSAISTAKKLSSGASKQLNYMLKHPLNAMITSKAGRETIRKTSRFLDDALRPVKVRTMQTVTGDNVFAGIERVASDGKLENKADQFLAAKQAERDRWLGEKGTRIPSSDVNNIKDIYEVNFGDHFAKGKRGRKELAPNVRYVTEDGYKYTTDDLGRIVEVKADCLILKEGKRKLRMQRVVGREYRRPDDDGGHLIGSQFHGSGDIDNLVAQNSQINRSGGEWYNMEKEWANALKEVPPKNVKVNIKPMYTEDSLRPDKFILKYQIEGNIAVRRVILNGNGG